MAKRKKRYHVIILREDGKQVHNRVLEWFQVRRHLTFFGSVGASLLLGTVAFFLTAAWSGNLVARNLELLKKEHQLKTSLTALNKTLDEARSRLSQSERQLASMEELAKQQNLTLPTPAGVGGPASDSAAPPPAGVSLADPGVRDLAAGIADLRDQADAVLHETQDVSRVLRPHLEELARTPSIWPVKGFIASGFGSRQDPLDGEPAIHEGIDISASFGSPVVAPAEGLIIFTGWKQGYGNCIEISHGNGLVTRYAHLSKILVKPGQNVKRWQRIGLVGSTGRSTGAHLHYEVRRNDRPINPKRFLLF
jgi:murein DD-endopeptidase MepM/ murein hydrolase activator NlpD